MPRQSQIRATPAVDEIGAYRGSLPIDHPMHGAYPQDVGKQIGSDEKLRVNRSPLGREPRRDAKPIQDRSLKKRGHRFPLYLNWVETPPLKPKDRSRTPALPPPRSWGISASAFAV